MQEKRLFHSMTTLLFHTLFVFVFCACSGRVVSRESNGAENGVKVKQKGSVNTSADVTAKIDTESAFGISLLSPPPSEITSNWYTTSLDGQQDTTYRFSLIHGIHQKCETWSDFLPVSEPLKVDLGADGAKTLCVQAKDKSGTLGSPIVLPFFKKSVREDGPHYTLHGKPAEITASSSARIFVNSADGIQYRYIVVSSATCGTLESEVWRSIKKPIENITFKHDGVWSLCLDIRDKFGNKNKIPHKYSWIRDTVYPVVNELTLPEGFTQLDELTFDISGNQVFEYQFAVVDGKSNCIDANYSPFKAANAPLTINLKTDGVRTLCVLTRNEAGLVQQQPYVKVIAKSKLKAEVKIQPIVVSRNASGALITKNHTIKFNISGAGVTHYKAVSLDRSDSCNNQSTPMTAPTPVTSTLEVSFSPGNIKTLCVWGIGIASDGSQSSQEIPTYVRFFNDTTDSTVVSDQTAKALSLAQASSLCSSCHELKTEVDFQNHAIQIATRLRDKEHPNPMPVGGWKEENQRTGMMLFLYSLPGYPQDLTQLLQ